MSKAYEVFTWQQSNTVRFEDKLNELDAQGFEVISVFKFDEDIVVIVCKPKVTIDIDPDRFSPDKPAPADQ